MLIESIIICVAEAVCQLPAVTPPRPRQHRVNFARHGSLAIFAAIRRASSLASNLAVDCLARLVLVIDVSELLPGAVLHDEAGANILNGPGRREAGPMSQNKYTRGADC
jgi:hypothetical protein